MSLERWNAGSSDKRVRFQAGGSSSLILLLKSQSAAQGPGCTLTRTFVGSIFDVFPVLSQEDVPVLSPGTVRRGNVVFHGFQPYDYLFGSLVVRFPAFRIKLGQYLVKTKEAELRVIKKLQFTPTNWWRGVIISSVYSSRLKVCHIAPPQLFLIRPGKVARSPVSL